MLVIDGAMIGDVFEWHVRARLCPVLKAGQGVVLANFSSHHRASIRTLIEGHSCTLLHLSPYNPDSNPGKMMCSKRI